MLKQVEQPKIDRDFTVKPRTVEELQKLGFTKNGAEYFLCLIETLERKIRESSLSFEGRYLAWWLVWGGKQFFRIGVTGPNAKVAFVQWRSLEEFNRFVDSWLPLIKILDKHFGGDCWDMAVHADENYAIVVIPNFSLDNTELVTKIVKARDEIQRKNLNVYFVGIE